MRDRAKDQRIHRYQPDLVIAFQCGDGAGEIVGPKPVITIQQSDQRRAGGCNRGIACARHALVRSCQKANARIGQVGRHSACDIIGRTIVNHQAFPRGEGLRQKRIECLAQ